MGEAAGSANGKKEMVRTTSTQLGITLRILSHNRRKFLEQALESAFSQTEPFDHVELYDNGSDFPLEDLRSRFPSLRLCGLPRAVPAAANIRRAFMERPPTTWLCVFHDDDLLLPHFHATMKSALYLHPAAGAVSCNGKVINDQGLENGILLPNLKKDLLLDGALDFARWYCEGYVPFPATVYRWSPNFGVDLDFASSFGRCCDVAFLSCVVQREPILVLASECFSYRRHDRQDSFGFLWWEETKRWELQVGLCTEDSPTQRYVVKKRNHRLTSRWLNAWLKGEPLQEPWRWDRASLSALHRFARSNRLALLRRLLLPSPLKI